MGLKKITEEHKIISFVTVLITTILVIRIMTAIRDPTYIIQNIELHHFYYGIIIIIISNILMLYRRSNFQTNLLLSGIAIGLIIDELIFVMGKLPNEKYFSTWPSVIILIVIILLITEFIFYKTKRERYQT